MNKSVPIVGTIKVIRQDPAGVIALVDGRRRVFPDLDAVFCTAIRLLDARKQPSVQSGLPRPQPLPGFAP